MALFHPESSHPPLGLRRNGGGGGGERTSRKSAKSGLESRPLFTRNPNGEVARRGCGRAERTGN